MAEIEEQRFPIRAQDRVWIGNIFEPVEPGKFNQCQAITEDGRTFINFIDAKGKSTMPYDPLYQALYVEHRPLPTYCLPESPVNSFTSETLLPLENIPAPTGDNYQPEFAQQAAQQKASLPGNMRYWGEDGPVLVISGFKLPKFWRSKLRIRSPHQILVISPFTQAIVPISGSQRIKTPFKEIQMPVKTEG